MKIIEENLLKNTIRQLNNFLRNHSLVNDFYDSLDELKLNSLQSFSFQKDNEFFDKTSFIMSVIASIIAHPHMSNRGENIILRSSQAGNLTNENFRETFKDPSLWKEKNLEMIPEYVHYYQYTDELKIYENRFIRLLIDIIDIEINKYFDFYNSLIPALENNGDTIIEENSDVEIAIKKLENLNRKLKHIKNTFFYKELSKLPYISKQIKPTNILLKDRLYNFCFKFYREFIKYEDVFELLSDFRLYYYFVILKEFKNRDFKLLTKEHQEQTFNINNLTFSYKNFIINLKIESIDKIYLSINLKTSPISFKHCLVLDATRSDAFDVKVSEDVVSTHIATIWNLIDAITKKVKFINQAKERDIIKVWLDSLLYEIHAKKSIYTKYCPICKSRAIDEQTEIFTCTNCHTIYTFESIKGQDFIWFINLRR